MQRSRGGKRWSKSPRKRPSTGCGCQCGMRPAERPALASPRFLFPSSTQRSLCRRAHADRLMLSGRVRNEAYLASHFFKNRLDRTKPRLLRRSNSYRRQSLKPSITAGMRATACAILVGCSEESRWKLSLRCLDRCLAEPDILP